jgi:hypothetical protein
VLPPPVYLAYLKFGVVQAPKELSLVTGMLRPNGSIAEVGTMSHLPAFPANELESVIGPV